MNKCITFDKNAQDNLPEHIKAKMKADRENARNEKLKQPHCLGTVSGRFIRHFKNCPKHRFWQQNDIKFKLTQDVICNGVRQILLEEVSPRRIGSAYILGFNLYSDMVKISENDYNEAVKIYR